ncbi:MAG: hypothetical protein FWF12_00415 [Betaproteobacteria bacterium]|nr:hypothetical protein [Betaproteobacteria bacterium]
MSDKQLEVLRVLVEGNTDGSFVDMDELLERVNYKPTKASMHFSIRHLIKRDLIEKKGTEMRRGRHRSILGATVLGHHFARANMTSPAAAILGAEDDLLELGDSLGAETSFGIY